MTPHRNPGEMPPSERVNEVAFLLAAGYLRQLKFRRNGLALSAGSAAPCVPTVNGMRAVPRRESA